MSDAGASPIGHQPAHASRVSQPANSSHHNEAQQLREEMRRIEERRRELSAQRAQIDHSRSRASSAGPVSARPRCASAAQRSESLIVHDPPGRTHIEPIIPEHRRLEILPHTASREMKEAMKESWTRDSALVSGYFLTKPQGKGGTFSRAQRFTNPVGYQTYYLSNDVQEMQSKRLRYDGNRYSVMTRGNFGTNVNSHWNDSKGGTAPGPGAYTPRWSAASAPRH